MRLSYSVSQPIGPNNPPPPGGANDACARLFWSLGNWWIPYTQSRKAILISTKSDGT